MSFFLAITLFPKVQEEAQEELDRVIGNKRLPVKTDEPNLPYITAIMKETHRWHTVAPLGLPHATMGTNGGDDVYEGFRIPKGSLLMANIWWFTHDPSRYPSPETFNPSRFLETPNHKAERDPRDFTFGYGRRICPGRYVADNALFITIAQSLAVFKFEKLVENGRGEPEYHAEPGLVSHLKPYRIQIKPRSEDHAKLIRDAQKQWPWEASDAKEFLSMKL